MSTQLLTIAINFLIKRSFSTDCAFASSVLNSDRAIEVNVQIMRTFVKLREMLSTHKDLARKLADMEKKYDAQFKVVFDSAIG